MKEDLILRKSKIQDEINKDDFEIDVRVHSYNFNDIQRQIILEP